MRVLDRFLLNSIDRECFESKTFEIEDERHAVSFHHITTPPWHSVEEDFDVNVDIESSI